LNAEYVDMVQQGVSSDGLLDYVSKTRPTLVGFTTWTTRINAAGYLAREIKDKYSDTMVCAGGSHATAIPKQTLKEFPGFDFLIRGEADNIIPEILATGNYSNIRGVVTRDKEDIGFDRILNLDDLAFPVWDGFDISKYPGSDPHQTSLELPISSSRGCYGSCVFCATAFGRSRIGRSVDSVIAEIDRNIADYDCKALCFQDDTFVDDPAETEKLMRAMINKGMSDKLKWSCEVRVDNGYPELFNLMKRAGCYYVYVGMESADDEMLRKCGKRTTVEQIRNTVGWIKDAGLVPAGSFILGLPGETRETAEKSIRLGEELNLYSTPYPIAVPFPGTPLLKMAEKGQHGLRLLPGADNWDNYGKQFPGIMESDKLSIDELRDLQKEAYRRIPKKKIEDFLVKD
ncbi:MAG: B12-binding domain-containing radical SAM protein, partial [Nanoarchaeota archaeon]|nr:B12-binding domain-containing radical SAM protein [Nanoarchaeota archaeon]